METITINEKKVYYIVKTVKDCENTSCINCYKLYVTGDCLFPEVWE
jgi:hypothetical protein